MSNYNNSPNNILLDMIENNFIVCFTSAINPSNIDSIEVLKEQGIPVNRTIFFENDCLIPFNSMPFINQQEDQQQFYMSISEMLWERNK